MPRRYHANNFSTTLAIGIGTGATSITLTSATGLPAIGTNEVYRLTLRYQGRMEIVEVTDDASSPTLTVTRAQESTTAQVFPVGSLVELRATANSLDRKQDQTATAGDVIDFGAAESFEIPNSATPTVNANGEIALDTSVADWSHGLIKYFGGEELFLVALPIAAATTPTNSHVVAYNATNDEFELVNPLDYDEGTFTPTFTLATPGDLSVSYSSQSGVYTRVGRKVFVDVTLNCTPTFTTGSGEIRIGSMPYTSLNNSVGAIGTISAGYTWPASRTQTLILINQSSNYCVIRCNGSAVGTTNMVATNIVSGAAINLTFSLEYQI